MNLTERDRQLRKLTNPLMSQCSGKGCTSLKYAHFSFLVGISAIVIMTPNYNDETMRNKPILADMKAVQDQLVQCIATGGRHVRWSI